MNGVLLRLKMHKRRPRLRRTCIPSMETWLFFFLESQSTKLFSMCFRLFMPWKCLGSSVWDGNLVARESQIFSLHVQVTVCLLISWWKRSLVMVADGYTRFYLFWGIPPKSIFETFIGPVQDAVHEVGFGNAGKTW